MNMNEENFAYKVRHALNEKLDDMPDDIVQRLEQARLAAVARKKATPLYVNVFQRVCAGMNGGFSGTSSWMARLGLGLPNRGSWNERAAAFWRDGGITVGIRNGDTGSGRRRGGLCFFTDGWSACVFRHGAGV